MTDFQPYARTQDELSYDIDYDVGESGGPAGPVGFDDNLRGLRINLDKATRRGLLTNCGNAKVTKPLTNPHSHAAFEQLLLHKVNFMSVQMP
ncbi:MAG: hypothetical protein NVS9B15_21440 [Acidobacteriaceae bacterium]